MAHGGEAERGQREAERSAVACVANLPDARERQLVRQLPEQAHASRRRILGRARSRPRSHDFLPGE